MLDLRRDMRNWSVGTSDVVIAPANQRRVGVLISSPPTLSTPAAQVPKSASQAAVGTSAAGIILLYIVPAGVQAEFESGAVVLNTGAAPQVQFGFIIGGSQVLLPAAVVPTSLTMPVGLASGDTALIYCAVGGVASTCGVQLSVREGVAGSGIGGYVTINFGNVAVKDQGINIYGGTLPLQLLVAHVGEALKEEIHAIGSATGMSISVTDIFTP